LYSAPAGTCAADAEQRLRRSYESPRGRLQTETALDIKSRRTTNNKILQNIKKTLDTAAK